MSNDNNDALEAARALSNHDLLERTESYVRRVDPAEPGLPLGPDGEPRQWKIGEAVYAYDSDEIGYVSEIRGLPGEDPENMTIGLSDVPGGPVMDADNYAGQLRRAPLEPLNHQVAMTVLLERVAELEKKATPTEEEEDEKERELARLKGRFRKLLNWKPPLGSTE